MTLKNSTNKFIKEVQEIKTLFKTSDGEIIKVIYNGHLTYGVSYKEILEVYDMLQQEEVDSNVCYGSGSTPTYQAIKLILERYQHDKED